MLRFLMTLASPRVCASVRSGSIGKLRPIALSLVALLLLATLPDRIAAQTTDDPPAAAASETAPAEPAVSPAEPESPAKSEPAMTPPETVEKEPAKAPEPAEPAPVEKEPAKAPSPAEMDPAEAPAPAPAEAEAPAPAEAEAPTAPSTEQPAPESADDAAPLVKQLGPITVKPVEEPVAEPTNWTPILLFLVVLVGAPALAAGIASSLRVREYQTKLTIIFLSLFAAGAIVYSGWPPKLGIDLKGGVYLVYETDQKAKMGKDAVDEVAGDQKKDSGSVNLSSEEMDKLVSAISRRINPGGVKEVVIRPFGQNQIEIVIPEVDESEIERYKEKITSAGTLEFRILANRRDPNHTKLIAAADERPDDRSLYLRDVDGNAVRDETGALKVLGWWVPASADSDVTRFSSAEIPQRPRKIGDRTLTEILVVNDMYNVTGGYLERSYPDVDRQGRPNVNFVFNNKGGQLFGGLTGENLPDPGHNLERQLGIVLDGYLFSAPAIRSQIRRQGEITGDFSKKQVADLVDVLNAGMLPTTLKEDPISQMATGPTLGKDTIRQSRIAITISLILVLVFMLAYYQFAGIVACAAMLANLLLILGVMIFVKAAFTLPGIAGLVLTVGMAVDANVLIFERIREELDRQATLRMAIRNGFARATTTIVDANLTTLITGVVLYTVGTDQVKGFAVTLILGVTLSMFTAIYCSRVVFDIAEKKRVLTKMRMARIPLSGTVDFIGLRRLAGIISVAVIVIGLFGVIGRGKGLMDIDFTGGVSVQAVFNQDQSIGEIRDLLNKNDVFEDLSVQEVNVADEPPHRRFVINTARHGEDMDADQFLKQVKTTLDEIFGDQLVHHSMTIVQDGGSPDPAASPESAASPEAKAPEKSDTSMLRNDLPADDLLAAAGDTGLLLAQAPTSEPAEPVKAEPAKAEKPESSVGEEPKPTDPVAESPATDIPAEKSAATTEFVSWDITFGDEDEIAYVTLEEDIQAQLKALGTNANVTLSNPEYDKDGDLEQGHKTWTVSINLPADEGLKVLESVKALREATPLFPSSNTIGGKVASDTQWKAVAALLASLVFVVAYIWIRFQRVMFGLAAVVALVHDVLITLGVIALTAWVAPFMGVLLIDEFKIGLPVLAAFLTIIGYSLNDTIVVFDRIREVRGKSPNLTAEMINRSINQTLSRTLLTSFTTLIVVMILYMFGGQAIRVFAFALVIGVIVGTYSSIFIASPVLLWIAQSSEARTRKH